MLAIDRRRRIMAILQEKKSVLVPELSKLFSVTEETIRRDLEKLEKEGLLRRTYGGAVLNESTSVDMPFNIREVTNIEGKQAIGLKAATFIEDGDTLMMDSSSTALQVAKSIKNKKNLTVITNSINILIELSNAPNIKIIACGGNLRQNSLSLVGYWSERILKNYNVNKAIICCKGLDMDKGILDSNEMEAHVKKTMIEAAQKVYLLVDSTKFDKVSFVDIADFSNIDVVFTEKKLSEAWEQFLFNNNIDIIYS